MARNVLFTLLLLAIGVTGCDTSPSAVDTQDHEIQRLTPDSLRGSTVSGDSVHWVNDYMAFQDSTGTLWEWEREGSSGVYPVAYLYRNGAYQGKLKIQYDTHGNIVSDTLVEAGQGWIDRTGDGDILDYSRPTDGPVEPYGGGIQISKAGIGLACIGFVDRMLGNCQAEYDQLVEDSWTGAIFGGLGAMLIVQSGGAATVPVASVMTYHVAKTMWSLGDYLWCKLT